MIRIHRQLVSIGLCLAALFTAASASAQTEMKVGTVDIDRVFSEFYKTKDAEETLNQARDAARKETETRWAARVPLIETVAGLTRELDSRTLSPTARLEKAKRRDDVINQIEKVERDVYQLNYTREMAIREQASRQRAVLVEEIMKVINDRAQAGGYTVVLDKSGSSENGVKGLLASPSEMDFSESVITDLNKSQPAPGSTPEAATPKPAAPKKPGAPKK